MINLDNDNFIFLVIYPIHRPIFPYPYPKNRFRVINHSFGIMWNWVALKYLQFFRNPFEQNARNFFKKMRRLPIELYFEHAQCA